MAAPREITEPIFGKTLEEIRAYAAARTMGSAAERWLRVRGKGIPCDPPGDLLLDGQEDTNGNGAVDLGETDPNIADTDGDGAGDTYAPASVAGGAPR